MKFIELTSNASIKTMIAAINQCISYLSIFEHSVDNNDTWLKEYNESKRLFDLDAVEEKDDYYGYEYPVPPKGYMLISEDPAVIEKKRRMKKAIFIKVQR